MLVLRTVSASDADTLFPLIHRTDVTDTILWEGPDSLEDYRRGLAQRTALTQAGESHSFTLVEFSLPDPDLPIGSLAIRPEERGWRGDLGLWIGKPYQSRGHGRQAISQALTYAFERLEMEKLEASVFVGNWPSRRIFEVNGFQLEGVIRVAEKKRGRFLDEWLFGITRADYARQQQAHIPASSPFLVHLCPRSDWLAALGQGEYRPASLAQEGFIHASRPDQILAVANALFCGQPDLLLLWLNPQLLAVDVRWESVGDEIYPHLYGPLNLSAVAGVTPFYPDGLGRFWQVLYP